MGMINPRHLAKGSLLSLRAVGKRVYSSHGPSPEEVYAKHFRKFDEKLAELRLDLSDDPERIEALRRDGKISDTLADGHITQILASRKAQGKSSSKILF
jgi:hypothetical protein